MVFSNLFFIYMFLPLSLIAYFLAKDIRTKNIVLLCFSLFFYAWGEPRYVFILVAEAFADYGLALLIEKYKDDRKKARLALVGAVAVDLGLLCVFKYLTFILENIRNITGSQMQVIQIALPIGISFYTFQLLSYVVDVYKGEVEAQKDFTYVLLYASLFHQCIAGPIVRYQDVCREIVSRTTDLTQISKGISRFAVGLGKKALLANVCGEIADMILLSDSALAVAADYEKNLAVLQSRPALGLWFGVLMYTLQIYLDFSAYSDMAIGMGQMIGFHYKENFDYPYMSKSVGEFWRRWHISLGSFFRDYVYIPLGGNRKGMARTIFNMFVVWALTGLWHGASWHYVFWGGLNGAYQVLGEWMRPVNKKLKQWFCVDETSFSHRLLRILLTFSLISVSWIFFRAGSVSQGIDILKRILGFSGTYWFTWGDNLTVMGLTEQTKDVLIVCLGILAAADICKYRNIHLIAWITKQGIWFRWLIYFTAIFGILIFGVYGPGYDASQFIYFQF